MSLLTPPKDLGSEKLPSSEVGIHIYTLPKIGSDSKASSGFSQFNGQAHYSGCDLKVFVAMALQL